MAAFSLTNMHNCQIPEQAGSQVSKNMGQVPAGHHVWPEVQKALDHQLYPLLPDVQQGGQVSIRGATRI